MFRVQEREGLPLFGTTSPQGNLPKIPFDFTLIDDARDVFLRFRVKRIYKTSLSVTPSIMCEADDMEDTKSEVMLKTFFLHDGDERSVTQRLLYETQAYRYVRQELVPYMSTVVPWYVTYMYKPEALDISFWNPEKLKQFRAEMRQSKHYEGFGNFYESLAANSNINLIFTQITKRVPNDHSLLQYMGMWMEDVDGMREIIFQIVFTLACMQILRIQHNDLHVNNILMNYDLPTKLKGYYVQNMVFWVPQSYSIRIFDWDQAFIEKIGNNAGLTNFKNIGVGNYFNPRYDLYTVVSSIENVYKAYKNEIPTELKKFITAVRPKLYQKDEIRLCHVDSTTQECMVFPPGEPKDILTPIQALQLPFFKNYFDTKPTILRKGPGFMELKQPVTPNFFTRLFK